ncbi:MAG: aminodeoxychorismate synthase component I [Balneolales bacterium]
MSAENYISQEKIFFFEDVDSLNQWIRKLLEIKREEGAIVFLDSQLNGHAASTTGYIAAEPVCCIRARDGRIFYEQIHGNNSSHEGPEEPLAEITGSPWDALKSFREMHPGWLFGWLGYDLKNNIELLESRNPDPVGLPDLFFFIPGLVLKIDRERCCIMVVKGELTADVIVPDQMTSGKDKKKYQTGNLISSDGPDIYCKNIYRIKEYITRGDTYEVNLTHQLRTAFEGDSLDLFSDMRRSGPVPFAAWLRYDDVEVCCSSPERFLERRGKSVRSQPIKGTSPRGTTPEQDEHVIHEILNREKNRAENVMIVDLVRHDLGQIARTGSVRMESLLEVQSFSTVHQLVSTITAEIREHTCSVDILKACFPMGSMTGAPKIRTMQIIEELESYRRGLYSGAIGYFTPEDDFDFNVVIRTAILKNGILYYPVGGAVTADSDPDEEWEETLLKARALGMEAPVFYSAKYDGVDD